MKKKCPTCGKKRSPHLFLPRKRMCEICLIAKKSGIKKERKEASSKTWIKKLDTLIGSRVRSRGVCEAVGRPHKGVLQWAHIVSRSYHNTRWMEDNALCLCAGCHKFYTDRPLEWGDFVTSKFGNNHLEYLKEVALHNPVIKGVELKELYEKLNRQGENKECPFCGVFFTVPAKSAHQVCCSKACAVKLLRDNPLKNYTVDKNGCWNWSKSLNSTGYGSVCRDGIITKAHRYFYEHFVGKIPDGLFLLHSCDNPACVNPDHLRPGTHQENIQDAVDRNRIAKGERIGPSKLTNNQVKKIKTILEKEYVPRTNLITKLAEKYRVSRVTIDDIRKGVWWGWLKV